MSPYLKTFAHTHEEKMIFRKNRKNTLSFLRVAKEPLIFNIIFVVLIFFLSVFYLIQVTGLMVYGFKIQELENNKNNLLKINQELELEKIRLETMGNLQSHLESLNLVKTDVLEYLKPTEGVLSASKDSH